MTNLKLTILLFFFASTINAQIITDSLQCYLPFSGDSIDESGNENNAIINGATLTVDRFGNGDSAYVLDGVLDYIKICNSNLTLSKNSTISFWFNPTFPLNEIDVPQVFLQSDPAGDIDGHFLIAFNRTNCLQFPSTQDGRINFEVQGDQINSNSSNCANFGLTRVSSNTAIWESYDWHMITLVVDNGELRIYVNAELENVQPSTSGVFVENQDIIIGGYIDGAQDRSAYRGAIDDLLIYNRALSGEEIQTVFNDNPTSINGLFDSPFIEVFPNPFINEVNLKFDFPQSETIKIEIYNASGNLVLTDVCNEGIYNLDKLKEKGLYILQFKNRFEKLIGSKKIIKL